jgi:Xaa-Pro aminopeptidase
VAERAKLPREILFLPQRVPGMEKWTGRKLGPSDPNAAATTGFTAILPAERFESELRRLLEAYPNLITTGPESIESLRKIAPGRNIQDAKTKLGNLRMAKSEREIDQIQHATDASIAAHRAAWKMMQPGQYEYEMAAVMTGSYMAAGCRRGAYAPIVGSGPNSTVLHYSRNARRMDSGEVAVMDVAAECDNHASDITRTVPVNGKFTQRQREVYDVVLGAQNAAIAAIKPGVTIRHLADIARDYMNAHGKDLHGEPLGKYFIHGLGHHVGLDVHDESTPSEPLKAGMVITIEPGIYIPEESLGVRIEDVVLVTETGSKILSAALPRDPDELERALAKTK